MHPKYWGVIVFLLTVAVATTPAGGSEAYVASASWNGDAAHMALNPDGSLSGPEDLQLMSESGLSGSGYTYGNGIGDFDGDGDLDYIMAVGRMSNGHVYIFPKTGPGQFGFPVRVASFFEGIYPADMTVADFNGDGKLDFVLSFLFSANCKLFLGRGEKDSFEFEPFLLKNTGTSPAIGIDAADFNNDQITDFIVAPNSDGPFLVSIGDGVNSFKTHQVPRPPGANKAYGIAAADFIKDDNGNADLAVSYYDSLDIYRGNGEGSFTLHASLNLPMKLSPLDNGDFNRDGIQDLIVGNFGDDPGSLAVLIGDGEGDFTYQDTDIYTRSGLMERKAVTALPYLSNKAPVAQLTPEIITVTVGETVEWDASASSDEDGTIVSYEWDYGDGVVSPSGINPLAKSGTDGNSGGTQSSYVYFDSGTYYVTLTVTDDQGVSASVRAEVWVEALSVKVYFSPRTLNLKSKGKWIKATIQLPDGYYTGQINPDSVYFLINNEAIKAHSTYTHRFYASKYKQKMHWRSRELAVKLDRQAVVKALNGTTGNTKLIATGEILSDSVNLEFSGSGIIKVYTKKMKKSSFKDYFKQQIMRLFS